MISIDKGSVPIDTLHPSFARATSEESNPVANPVEIRFRPHKAGLGEEGLEFGTLKRGI